MHSSQSNRTPGEQEGHLALHFAAANDHVNAISLLLDCDANLAAVDKVRALRHAWFENIAALFLALFAPLYIPRDNNATPCCGLCFKRSSIPLPDLHSPL